jgi:small subunit ribosomal protein S20
VPTVKSAAKRMRRSRVQNDQNRMWRSRLRTQIKNVRSAESPEAAQEALNEAIPVIDRTASRGIIHQNAAARQKSRLTKFVRQMTEAA